MKKAASKSDKLDNKIEQEKSIEVKSNTDVPAKKEVAEKKPSKVSATKVKASTNTTPKKEKIPKAPTEKTASKKASSSTKTTKVKAAEPAKKAVAKETKIKGDVRVILQFRFHTQPGQTVWITSSGLLLGDSVLRQMYYEDNEHWRLDLTVKPELLKEDIRYKYHIKNVDGSWMDDYQEKAISLNDLQSPLLFVRDFWSYAGYHENVYDKGPFDYLIKREISKTTKKTITATTTYLFQVKVPYTKPEEGVCLLGENDALGNWDSKKYKTLAYNSKLKVWETGISIKGENPYTAYKYGIFDKNTKEIVHLEDGDNRHTFTLGEKGLVIQNDGFINLTEKHWKGAGLNIPLFSIRTNDDLGIGDIGSIKTMVDWMSSVGLKLLQLLPINDTTVTKTWEDSYPYSAISVFALHPIYINISQLLTPSLKEKATIKELLGKGKQLNELTQVDYESVLQLKWQLIEEVYAVLKKDTFANANYKSFLQNNEDWLKPYAAFSVLRDQYKTADYEKWNDADNYTEQVFEQLYKNKKEKIQLYFFVQYILSQQLSEAVQYAHSHQIVLKGDIPIGVDRYSVDVWQHPQLFDTTMQAGAPPDYFTKEGQNWGFPTYRWDVMEKDDYAWWKRRLTNMAQYFDAIRIDHILGFFRIWSIPTEQVQGLLGYFQPCIAIDETEFASWNLSFSYDRYCKPFINTQILIELFGDKVSQVKTDFLDYNENGTYSFKPEFDTQRKIQDTFDSYEKNEHNDWLLKTLLSLMANVILIPDKQAGKYHCRFVLYETSSYAYLSDWEKQQLYYLYNNYYFERQNDYWRKIGVKQLNAISSVTDMMICGEDLGMVPKIVSSVLGQLGFLGLKVQRMASDGNALFTNPLHTGFLNVVTPSTHDMPPIRNWWNSESGAAKDSFYRSQLGLDGFPPEKCDGTVVSQIVFNHLESPSLWSVFLIQDLLCMEDATSNPNVDEDIINRPEITHFYWRYRMHLSVEKLQKAEQLNGKIKNLLQLSNR